MAALTAVSPASAEGPSGRIEQISSNTLKLRQTGIGQRANVEQSAAAAGLAPGATRHVARLYQFGVDNAADVRQSGQTNALAVKQFGAGLDLKVEQSGPANALAVGQVGFALGLKVEQSGNNRLRVTQFGVGNGAPITIRQR